MGGQEHFYLETQVCLVVPKGEDEEFEIYASSQSPTDLQMEVILLIVKNCLNRGRWGTMGHR